MYVDKDAPDLNTLFGKLTEYRNMKLEHTPSWRIFNKVYYCESLMIASMTVEELKRNPVKIFQTGIPDIDGTAKDEMVKRYLSIDRMVELHHRHVNVRIINPNDLHSIYNDVYDHLEMWYAYILLDYSCTEVPIFELEMMGAFASDVYHLIYSSAPKIIRSHNDALSKFGQGLNPFMVNYTEREKIKTPPHEKYMDLIASCKGRYHDETERLY